MIQPEETKREKSDSEEGFDEFVSAEPVHEEKATVERLVEWKVGPQGLLNNDLMDLYQ